MLLRTHARNGGFSMLETMAVLTISAVLMTFAVPGISKNAEVVRMDKAASDLRALWRAERRYHLEHGTFTSSLVTLQSLEYIRPALASATDPFTYTVTVGNRSQLTVEAKRTGSTNWFGIIRINEFGELTGDIKSKDGHLLTP